MKIKRQKCKAHFRGSDGKGTCDTKCQWYRSNSICPNSAEAKVTIDDLYESEVTNDKG